MAAAISSACVSSATRSARDDRGKRLADDVHNEGRRRHGRRVIDGMRVHPGPHPPGHEMLVLAADHAILLRHEEPARTVLPERPIGFRILR